MTLQGFLERSADRGEKNSLLAGKQDRPRRTESEMILSRSRQLRYFVSSRQSFRACAAFSKMCGETPRLVSDSPSFMRKKPLVV